MTIRQSIRLLATVTVGLTLIGCASTAAPIIDKKGVNMAEYRKDLDECRAYSAQVSVAKGVAKGGVLGAAVGAAAGAISGNADAGAGYGAASGATRSGVHNQRMKNNVVKRCLSGRGYKILN